MQRLLNPIVTSCLIGCTLVGAQPEPPRPARVETIRLPTVEFSVSPETGGYELRDRQAGVIWKSNPHQARFGEAALLVGGKPQRVPLTQPEVTQSGSELRLSFRPLAEEPSATLRVLVRPLADKKTLEFSCAADDRLKIESVRLLDDALWVTDAERGYAVVPVREGLLVPADSGLAFTHRFDTYAYEGCHMAMFGMVKNGAAALVTWSDPYVAVELKSAFSNAPFDPRRSRREKALHPPSPPSPSASRSQSLLTSAATTQVVSASLVLRKSAKSFRIQFLGKGDYNTIARAYREVAREHGWLVAWKEKLKGRPERTQLFGASNFKLWTVLSRRMSEDSTKEESVTVHWTFDEAAQVAEHLKRDLQIDKCLFTVGGWMHRGYDNQHPDILPTAPECGGDTAFADCARRVMALGYLFCPHDNYQDIYRDSPSWNEDLIMKTADGQLAVGGRWLGGRAYLTCSKQALALARRPQNLTAVKQLAQPNAYFIDTTYAAGLQECFDPKHPLTRADDMRWKQALSDYAREVFGVFGSECGREWAIPHSDFFEGLTGVSGRHFHDANLEKTLGAVVVPLFELVYRDCIAMWGKYGYEPSRAAAYVLDHISLARPLNYHSVPAHLYWKDTPADAEPLAVHPTVSELKQTGPRQFSVRYRWTVEKSPASDWRVFVHFTDASDGIKFQNDHEPPTATSQWQPGEVNIGPLSVTVPAGLEGTFPIHIGLFRPGDGRRAPLADGDPDDRRVLVGRLKVAGDTITFEPAAASDSRPSKGDPGVFTRADNGWAAGLHPLDRFLKNTHEILSPLNELTAQVPMTRHEFLTPDRTVRRTVFGKGRAAVEVVVNGGDHHFNVSSKLGGEVELPPFGFLAEAPTFVAFHARSWNGVHYEAPALFTLRSQDSRPVHRSTAIRVFHGFGDERVRVGKSLHAVRTEAVVRR
jgi:hypothetical protein